MHEDPFMDYTSHTPQGMKVYIIRTVVLWRHLTPNTMWSLPKMAATPVLSLLRALLVYSFRNCSCVSVWCGTNVNSGRCSIVWHYVGTQNVKKIMESSQERLREPVPSVQWLVHGNKLTCQISWHENAFGNTPKEIKANPRLIWIGNAGENGQGADGTLCPRVIHYCDAKIMTCTLVVFKSAWEVLTFYTQRLYVCCDAHVCVGRGEWMFTLPSLLPVMC